LVQDLDEAVK
jgi:hypothetical protein